MEKKKIFAVITAVMMLAMLCGCGDEEKDTESSKQESSAASTDTSGESSGEASKIHPTSSSLASPLSLEEWGKAAKYSADRSEYATVPVRIVRIYSGNQAEKEVKRFTSADETYTYKAPDIGCQWVIADYEINLDSFPAGKAGADASVSSFVTAADGSNIEYKGKKYAVYTMNITDGEYYYEGIRKGSIAYEIPTGCTDYIITLGEYDEQQAFYTPGSDK